MKLFALLLALSATAAQAQTVNCPNVAQIDLNADQATLTYSPALGLTVANDVAYFVSADANATVYRTSQWDAQILLSTALVDGRVKQGPVVFIPNGKPNFEATCTLE